MEGEGYMCLIAHAWSDGGREDRRKGERGEGRGLRTCATQKHGMCAATRLPFLFCLFVNPVCREFLGAQTKKAAEGSS